MSFLGGKNTGGDRADYYDNPNYDPIDEGKSKSSKKAEDLGDAVSDYENKYNYMTQYVDEETDLGRGGSLKFEEDAIDAAAKSLDAQTRETVSYFRGKEKNRLNPGGVGGKQINPKFSQPASLYTKLGKFGFSYDPTAPDTFFDEVFNLPDKAVSQYETRKFDTSGVANPGWIQETMEYKKDSPMDKTVAGVNQELQARKARTRDFAMEFRGTVYDFIDATRENLKAETSDLLAEYSRQDLETGPTTYTNKEIEDKFFPDEASKKAARVELKKIIAFTDEASDISRNYSNLTQYAETIVGDTKDTPYGILDHGIRGPIGEKKWVNEELTKQKYEKSVKAFSDWKSKKGVPKIVRLISKLG